MGGPRAWRMGLRGLATLAIVGLGQAVAGENNNYDKYGQLAMGRQFRGQLCDFIVHKK